MAAPAGARAAVQEEVGSYINLSPVAVPIVVDDVVVNYVFVRVRLNLEPDVDSPALRLQEPYFRDALVRAAHRTPFTDSTDHTVVDERRLTAAMLREARQITHDRSVANVQVMEQTPKSLRVATSR